MIPDDPLIFDNVPDDAHYIVICRRTIRWNGETRNKNEAMKPPIVFYNKDSEELGRCFQVNKIPDGWSLVYYDRYKALDAIGSQLFLKKIV